VHAEVSGLDPDRWYWYQFRTGDHLSPIGRTRTFPKAGASVNQLKFAFASCQHYEQGYYTAYQAMAAEDLDVTFCLGDYIYEGAGVKDRPRLHVGPELTTLADYRDRYAQYKTDPLLQAAHANNPWILTWDDHEVANNYAEWHSAKNDPRDIFLARRAAAYHAYYEHQPLRKTSMPHDAYAQMYRPFQYGTLASFFVLDTRQYRSDQPCDDGTKALCEAALDGTRSMMGDTQEKWLYNSLDRSRAAWNVIPQQVMMGAVDQESGPDSRYSMDQWPGYFAELTDVMAFSTDANRRTPWCSPATFTATGERSQSRLPQASRPPSAPSSRHVDQLWRRWHRHVAAHAERAPRESVREVSEQPARLRLVRAHAAIAARRLQGGRCGNQARRHCDHQGVVHDRERQARRREELARRALEHVGIAARGGHHAHQFPPIASQRVESRGRVGVGNHHGRVLPRVAHGLCEAQHGVLGQIHRWCTHHFDGQNGKLRIERCERHGHRLVRGLVDDDEAARQHRTCGLLTRVDSGRASENHDDTDQYAPRSKSTSKHERASASI
jgi:hypothetical protein